MAKTVRLEQRTTLRSNKGLRRWRWYGLPLSIAQTKNPSKEIDKRRPYLCRLTKVGRTISGVTLVEILIAMALVVALMSISMPAISRITYQKVNSTSRRFVALVRTVRNDSILLSNIYRLVIDMETATYWVESQKQLRLIGEEDEESRKKREKAKKKDEPQTSDDANFVPVEKYNKKPIDLPSGVVFDGVLKEQEGLIKQGKAYINFFPSGFVEQSIIYLNKEGATTKAYSVIVRPTAGRVDVQNKFIETFDDEESK